MVAYKLTSSTHLVHTNLRKKKKFSFPARLLEKSMCEGFSRFSKCLHRVENDTVKRTRLPALRIKNHPKHCEKIAKHQKKGKIRSKEMWTQFQEMKNRKY